MQRFLSFNILSKFRNLLVASLQSIWTVCGVCRIFYYRKKLLSTVQSKAASRSQGKFISCLSSGAQFIEQVLLITLHKASLQVQRRQLFGTLSE
jgi:hypothetical protein